MIDRIIGLVIILFLLTANYYYFSFAWAQSNLRFVILLVAWMILGSWTSAVGMVFGIAMLFER